VYIVLNERLSLNAPTPGIVGVREVSRSFRMPEGDDALFLTIVVINVTGTSPGILATLEGSDDNENWSDSGSILTFVTVGTIFAATALLAGRLYRMNWLFGSASSAATIVLAANVETSHV
jgi:hypothetical protein